MYTGRNIFKLVLTRYPKTTRKQAFGDRFLGSILENNTGREVRAAETGAAEPPCSCKEASARPTGSSEAGIAFRVGEWRGEAQILEILPGWLYVRGEEIPKQNTSKN